MGMDYSDLAAASQPDALRAVLADNADELRTAGQHHDHRMASVRRVRYKGHDIVVRTTYEITIDGEPFDTHLTVDNSGRVHYHGLPTRDFGSAIDLMRKVIDQFSDFADRPGGGDEHEHQHQPEHSHEHQPDHGGQPEDDHGPHHEHGGQH
jgi:hypothetical protein